MVIKAQLQRYMDARDWKVADLSYHAKVSDAAVYNILNGADPRLSTVARIARALGVTVGELINDAEVDQYLDDLRNKLSAPAVAA